MNYRYCGTCGSSMHGYDTIRGTCTSCVQRASRDAQQKLLRQEVYQEGQRAANSGAPCPYTDWRAGTWAKGLAAAKAHYEAQVAEDSKPQVTEMRSAGWIIRRAGCGIQIESPDGSGTGISRTEGDVFDYFDALLRENGL
jgi:hypothetical protein